MKKQSKKFQLEFTGERMIPELNRGKALYYEHLSRYVFCLQFVKNKKVVDLGCGTGYGSYLIAEAGASKVEGIDIAENAIQYAKVNFKNNKIAFRVDDIQKISQFKKFDLAVAFEVIEHLNNQQSFLEGTKQMLHNNGILIISTPNKNKSTQTNTFHTKEFNPDEFRKLLKEYFKYVYLFYQSFSFANIINSEEFDNKNYHLKSLDKFKTTSFDAFLPKSILNNAMYLVAVCSEKPIRRIQPTSLMSLQVDEFSLENSIEGLTEKFIIKRRIETNALEQKIIDLQKKNSSVQLERDIIQYELNAIINSKFLVLWKIYNKVKKLFKIRL